MILNIHQMSKVACLIDDAGVDIARVDPAPNHDLDHAVIVRVPGRIVVLDAGGRELPSDTHVLAGAAA